MKTENTKTLLTIKVDKKIKKAAQKVAKEIGIPLGTFLNMTLKQFARNKEVSFVGGYTASPALDKSLRQTEREIARGDYDNQKGYSLEQLRKKWKLD